MTTKGTFASPICEGGKYMRQSLRGRVSFSSSVRTTVVVNSSSFDTAVLAGVKRQTTTLQPEEPRSIEIVGRRGSFKTLS